MSQTIKTRSGRTIMRPTPEEDAAITAAALSDPDATPLTDEEWALVKPTLRRGRPVSANPKVFTAIRLDPEVLEAFKGSGRGWQTRINAALKDWLNTHSPSDATHK
jgi:uncharacterized protein (DUF4415 family)